MYLALGIGWIVGPMGFIAKGLTYVVYLANCCECVKYRMMEYLYSVYYYYKDYTVVHSFNRNMIHVH